MVASSGKLRWGALAVGVLEVLHQTFHEWAPHSIAYSDWAREYYDQQRLGGHPKSGHTRSLQNRPTGTLKDRSFLADSRTFAQEIFASVPPCLA